jgi:hypothetical protein
MEKIFNQKSFNFKFVGKFAEIFASQGATPVSLILVVHLELRISPRIFENFEMTLMLFQVLGEDDS